MNEFVATVIGEVNAALKKKGWKKRGCAPSIEAIVEKTTELLRVATDKELAAAYGDEAKSTRGGRGRWTTLAIFRSPTGVQEHCVLIAHFQDP